MTVSEEAKGVRQRMGEPEMEGQGAFKELQQTAIDAVLEWREVRHKTSEYFRHIHLGDLSVAKSPRVQSLVLEANCISSIPIPVQDTSPHDLIRIVETCKRKTEWLTNIVRQCESLFFPTSMTEPKVPHYEEHVFKP